MRSAHLLAADTVRAYVATHFADERLTADDVLDALRLHGAREHVRIGLGQPLGAYIRAYRLARACCLLRDTDIPIIQVAFEVGYGSHEALTHAFGRAFRTSPSAYRQKSRTIKQSDQAEEKSGL